MKNVGANRARGEQFMCVPVNVCLARYGRVTSFATISTNEGKYTGVVPAGRVGWGIYPPTFGRGGMACTIIPPPTFHDKALIFF